MGVYRVFGVPAKVPMGLCGVSMGAVVTLPSPTPRSPPPPPHQPVSMVRRRREDRARSPVSMLLAHFRPGPLLSGSDAGRGDRKQRRHRFGAWGAAAAAAAAGVR